MTGTRNLIAYNLSDGVRIDGGDRNTVRGNRIYENSALGIDLGASGPTDNDNADADSGANLLQNYPILNYATLSDSNAVIHGDIHSAPNTSYQVDFFRSVNCDVSGYGEGEFYLGNIFVTTDTGGDASFVATSTPARLARTSPPPPPTRTATPRNSRHASSAPTAARPPSP